MLSTLDVILSPRQLRRWTKPTRVVVSGSARFGALRPRPHDLVIALETNLEIVTGASQVSVPHPDENLHTRLNEWVSSMPTKQDPCARAALRAQVPFLVDWVTYQLRNLACISGALAEVVPDQILLHALPDDQKVLVECYARSRGISVAAFPSKSSARRQAHRWFSMVRQLREARVSSARGATISAERGGVLIASLQINSTRALLPVAERLRNSGVRVRFLLNGRDASSAGEISAKHFDWVSDDSFPTINTRRSLPERDFWGLDARKVVDLVERLNLPHWVCRKTIGAHLQRELAPRLRRSYLDAQRLFSALDTLRPEVLIFSTRRALFDEVLRSRRSIRSIFFLQGIIPDIPAIGTPLDVDMALVGSRLEHSYAARCDIPPDRLRTVGYCQYDHYPELERKRCRDALRESCPSVGERPIVVFLSQYPTPCFPEWARQHHLREIVRAARLLPSHFFVVKLHPVREGRPDFLDRCPPDNLLVGVDVPTDVAMKGADACVTYWSTTALEAVLLGTRLIQLNSTGLPDYFDLSARLGQSIARNANDLVRRLLEGGLAAEGASKPSSRGSDLHIVTDGKASERAAHAILSTLQNGARGAEGISSHRATSSS